MTVGKAVKKFWKICATAFCCVLMICLWSGCANQSDEREYLVAADYGNLPEYVNARLEQDGVAPEHQEKMTTVYDEVSLEGRKIILTEIVTPLKQPRLGVVELELGANGQYKVGFISYTTQNIKVKGVEGKETEYLVIAGRNPDKTIRKIVSTQEGKRFSVEIPEKELYLVAVPTEDAEEMWDFDPNSWHFYNAAGEDITEEVDW